MSDEVPQADVVAIEARVLAIVVETSGVDADALQAGASLSTALDSLTLAAVVARVEATFDIALAADETLELLMARDVGALCRLIARRVAGPRANFDENT